MSTDLATSDRAIVTVSAETTSPPATVSKAAMAMARDQGSEAATDQVIRLLARSLGRQAARRHLARGWSMMEVALALAVAALALAAALYLTTVIERLP